MKKLNLSCGHRLKKNQLKLRMNSNLCLTSAPLVYAYKLDLRQSAEQSPLPLQATLLALPGKHLRQNTFRGFS